MISVLIIMYSLLTSGFQEILERFMKILWVFYEFFSNLFIVVTTVLRWKVLRFWFPKCNTNNNNAFKLPALMVVCIRYGDGLILSKLFYGAYGYLEVSLVRMLLGWMNFVTVSIFDPRVIIKLLMTYYYELLNFWFFW